MERTADIVVVGAGIHGTSLAYHLARARVGKVVVLERTHIAAGSTGRSMAVLRQHYSNEVGIRLARCSVERFATLEEELGADIGFRKSGFLLLAPSSVAEAAHRNVALQRNLGVDAETISAEAVESYHPLLRAEGTAVACVEHTSGYADPNAATRTFARRAVELGVKLYQDVEVTAILKEGERIVGVATSQGTIAAPVVVNAAGPWARRVGLMAGVDLPLQLYRVQVAILRGPTPYVAELPTVVDLRYVLGYRPYERGTACVTGGAKERELVSDPEGYRTEADEEFLGDVTHRFAQAVPAFATRRVVSHWAGLYTVSPDHYPIVGPIEEVPGFYCICGFSGHGFKLGPAVGQCMAELIERGQATTVDISSLNLRRLRERRLFLSAYREFAVMG